MTTKLPPEEYLKYWEGAKAEEIGIEIKVEPEDQVKFVNALYEAKQFCPADYENLIVIQPQPAGTIFVMKKSVELPA